MGQVLRRKWASLFAGTARNDDPSETEALNTQAGTSSGSEGDTAGDGAESLPPWHKQLTVRGLVIAAGLGAIFCIVVHKLMLTAGLFPTFNTSAGLLSFIALKSWAWLSARLGFKSLNLGAQETTVVQTFIIACCNIAFSGGFSLQLGALSASTWAVMNDPVPLPGDSIEETAEPTLGKTIPLLLCVSVIGVFTVVFLRKLFIIDYGLPYPSGAATGVLINSFFTAKGEATAKKQIGSLLQWLSVSFLWGMFKWFYSGRGCDVCKRPGAVCNGFTGFPTFGINALAWKWNFDFALNLVGTGMICSHAVNWSIMLGAVLSWGMLWPIINSKRGVWYPADTDQSSMQGLYGYKIFITLAIFMSDGLYSISKVLLLSALHLHKKRREAEAASKAPPVEEAAQQLHDEAKTATSGGFAADLEHMEPGLVTSDGLVLPSAAGKLADGVGDDGDGVVGTSHGGEAEFQGWKETEAEKALRTRVFLADRFPLWWSVTGYLTCAVLGTIVIPMLYPKIKWYQVSVAYLLAVAMALPNAYGDGLTDWDMASMYGKLGIVLFAAWSGSDGGITTGLISCCVLLVATSTAAHLMQDFRTGYLTLAAPKAMFCSQIVGAILGVLLAPLTFQLFWSTGEVGQTDGPYPNPLAKVYRAMAVVGSEGLGHTMPPHCGTLVLVFFFGIIALNGMRDLSSPSVRRFLPVPMAIGIPFYLGAYLAVDMCIGSLINLVWAWLDPAGQEQLGIAVAAGLLVGDGVWTVPASLLAMANVKAPLCMAFQNVP